jgi:hypothetical protein
MAQVEARLGPAKAAGRGQEIPVGSRWKRAGTFVIYVVGAVAIGYLALYAYVMFTRPQLVPGEPIQIFRKPDAPKYS